jgi:hypothetical protein
MNYGPHVGPNGAVFVPDDRLDEAYVALKVKRGDWKPAPVSAPAAAPEGAPAAKWTTKQLTAFAEANGIDLGGATKKDDILAILVPAPANAGGEGTGD